MPNKCTGCGKVYEEGSNVILEGCECGNRLFLYFRKVSDEEAEELKVTQSIKEVKDKKIKEQIKGIEDTERHIKKNDEPPDIWNVKAGDGVYDLDIASLMMKEPVIVRGEEGRYLLSLSSAFREGMKGKAVKYTKRGKK